jgi:hypothetical protein
MPVHAGVPIEPVTPGMTGFFVPVAGLVGCGRFEQR